MAEEITRNEKLKSDFIASISHELRTPLTSIKGWTITLRHDLNHRQLIEEGLIIIEKESDRLSVMLEELLDFSKFEVGKVILQISDIDLNEFVANIYKQMKPRQRQGLRFELQTSQLPSILSAA
jgi:signal transduction histidine kinase